MTAKVMDANLFADHTTYDIWIDTAKTGSDGVSPDPAYVKTIEISNAWPPDVSTDAEFQNYVTGIMKQFADLQNQLLTGVPSSDGGCTVPVNTTL